MTFQITAAILAVAIGKLCLLALLWRKGKGLH